MKLKVPKKLNLKVYFMYKITQITDQIAEILNSVVAL